MGGLLSSVRPSGSFLRGLVMWRTVGCVFSLSDAEPREVSDRCAVWYFLFSCRPPMRGDVTVVYRAFVVRFLVGVVVEGSLVGAVPT